MNKQLPRDNDTRYHKCVQKAWVNGCPMHNNQYFVFLLGLLPRHTSRQSLLSLPTSPHLRQHRPKSPLTHLQRSPRMSPLTSQARLSRTPSNPCQLRLPATNLTPLTTLQAHNLLRNLHIHPRKTTGIFDIFGVLLRGHTFCMTATGRGRAKKCPKKAAIIYV